MRRVKEFIVAEIHQFVYPAVFVQGEAEVAASFPDLGITTEGESFEEAFLFAKDFLRVYCSYALKFDLDINKPSYFTDIIQKHKNENPMLIDALLFPRDLK